MATMALPSQSFADIQRYHRQKKATGATVSPRETKLAWQGYWDAMSSRQFQGQQLGIQERGMELNEAQFAADEKYRKEQLRMQEQAQSDAEAAARISGYSSGGTTLLTAGYLAKGTKLGGYIGMGPATAATPGGGGAAGGVMAGAAPTPATSAAAPLISAGGGAVGAGMTAPVGGSLAGSGLEGVGTGGMYGGTAAGGTTAGGVGAGAGVGLGTAGVGLGVGYAAAHIPIGKGKSAGMAKGAIAGALVGTMIMPGAGTIVGAVFGAMGGFIKEAK